MDAAVPFLQDPFLAELSFLQVAVEQEPGEKEEPAHGDGAQEMREHLRDVMVDIDTVQRPLYRRIERPDRMLEEHQDDERKAHRLDEFGLSAAGVGHRDLEVKQSISAFERTDYLFLERLRLPGTTVEVVQLDRACPLAIRVGDGVRGINRDAVGEVLRLVLALPGVFFFQYFRQNRRNGGQVERPVFPDELAPVIKIQALLDKRMARRRTHDGGFQIDLRVLFIAHLQAGEEIILQQAVQLPEGPDIGIQVNAAFVVQGIQPDIIRHEGPLPVCKRIPGERDGVVVQTVHIPQLDLIVGKMLAPTGDTLPDDLRLRIVAEPAVMYNARYHFSMILAGTPTTVTPGVKTSFTTTAPAPMRTLSAILIPPMIWAFCPMSTLSPMTGESSGYPPSLPMQQLPWMMQPLPRRADACHAAGDRVKKTAAGAALRILKCCLREAALLGCE